MKDFVAYKGYRKEVSMKNYLFFLLLFFLPLYGSENNGSQQFGFEVKEEFGFESDLEEEFGFGPALEEEFLENQSPKQRKSEEITCGFDLNNLPLLKIITTSFSKATGKGLSGILRIMS